jgi:hypothetical protein
MYTTCPKCKYERQAHDNSGADVCPACGIIFSKWMKQQYSSPTTQKNVNNKTESRSYESGLLSIIYRSLFYVEDKVNPFIFYGRVIVFIGIVIWGWQFINMDFINNPNEIGSSFMHRVNLIFHEAGHVIFMPFGWFMTKLGGTLGQLLMPIIVMLVFLIKSKNNFGASVALWWLGQSFMDCAPYIDDALDRKLVLLGGFTGADKPGSHDWTNILSEFDKIEAHREIANTFNSTGIFLIVIACIWGGFLIYKQFKNLDRF